MAWAEPQVEPEWHRQIPDDQWAIYERVIQAARSRRLRFALGGGFAIATYTGQWRNTKDMDVYVVPRDREAMIETVLNTGLSDYYDTLPYDRTWIFRTACDKVIVDIIWAMANRRADVDDLWLERAPSVTMRGERLLVVPPEDMVWNKLYVLQRDRSDWPDVFNLIEATGPELDWGYLLRRLEKDVPLLAGALSVYGWLCPACASKLPAWLWERVDVPRPAPADVPERAGLLDRRPWFRFKENQ